MARRRIKRKGDSLLRDGLILCAIAAVFALILGGIFMRTEKNMDDASDAARLEGYKNAYRGYDGVTFEEDGELDKAIKEYNSENSGEADAYIDNAAVAKDSEGNPVGYAFIAHAKGYSDSGDITIAAGVDNAGAVTGIDIVYMNETAGIGDGCTDEEFKDQFKGKSGKITINGGGGQPDNAIDGLSGATQTTAGVVNAVNICLDAASKLP